MNQQTLLTARLCEFRTLHKLGIAPWVHIATIAHNRKSVQKLILEGKENRTLDKGKMILHLIRMAIPSLRLPQVPEFAEHSLHDPHPLLFVIQTAFLNNFSTKSYLYCREDGYNAEVANE